MKHAEYAERVKKMNPIDDDFLRKMAEDINFCQEIIQTILEDPHIKVVEVRPQNAIKNLQGRSVILDALCVTEAGEHINVEVQKSDDDNHQKRVRYNAACVTANITDPGSKFENIPTVCVIYITRNDFLKKGKTVYHVDRIIRETGDRLFNGFSEIYVNTCVKDGSLTSELMTIFTEDSAYDDRKFPSTSGRKRYFKENERGVREMCAIMEEIREEGRLEGLEEGVFITYLRLYQAKKLSLNDVCLYLNCTPEAFFEMEKKYTGEGQ